MTAGRDASKGAVMAELMMPLWAVPDWLPGVLNFVLLLSSLILIGLVLIQKGQGGGLAGAFGGSGGSSAFGSRAGDAFTRITIYTAAVWILLIMFMIKMTQVKDPLQREPTIENPPSAPS